ncbi:MAG TPA: viral A-type inclusion protein [Chitinophagaceae bacterium]|nr:viral A-type inclusion protein [Chitinophagaceae bacterium]
MKSIVYCVFLSVIFAMSCSNDNARSKGSKTQLDSLLGDVIDGHNIGMAKMGRLTRAGQTTKRLLDSIAKLPEKARLAAEPLKVKLDSLQKDLSYAEFAMNKWMDEFNVDSAINNAKERIKYLEEEKLKVTKVKEAILGSLQRADSLLKVKF